MLKSIRTYNTDGEARTGGSEGRVGDWKSYPNTVREKK
jgi:hypothetical protein